MSTLQGHGFPQFHYFPDASCPSIVGPLLQNKQIDHGANCFESMAHQGSVRIQLSI